MGDADVDTVSRLLTAGRGAPEADRRVAFAPEHLDLVVLSSDSEPSLLDQVVANEQVHAIEDADDLRRRLAPDRRILALCHRARPDRLLVFVEIALTTGLDVDMEHVLHGPVGEAAPADTAVFYSINRCEDAVAGLDVASDLLERAVTRLRGEVAGLERCSTLSPVPNLRAHVSPLDPDLAEAADGSADRRVEPEIRDRLEVAAEPLTGGTTGEEIGPHTDPVARFHLGNGARRVALRWADPSPTGWARSWGLMANYQYWP